MRLRIGFRTSIITVFIAVVLFVGLTLVYLSFERVSLITRPDADLTGTKPAAEYFDPTLYLATI